MPVATDQPTSVLVLPQQPKSAVANLIGGFRQPQDSSPLVDVPGDHGHVTVPAIQPIQWYALRAYAEAGRSAYDFSVIQPVLLPHNFMINTPHVVQNLTIQVLKVEEGY